MQRTPKMPESLLTVDGNKTEPVPQGTKSHAVQTVYISLSASGITNISCQYNQVIIVQLILYGAVCTFVNATCITDKLTMAQLYLKIAEEHTLDGIREECNGSQECDPELYPSRFLHHLCSEPKYEINDIRVYFTCQDMKYTTRSWMTGWRKLLMIVLACGVVLFMVSPVAIRAIQARWGCWRKRRILKMLPSPDICNEFPNQVRSNNDNSGGQMTTERLYMRPSSNRAYLTASKLIPREDSEKYVAPDTVRESKARRSPTITTKTRLVRNGHMTYQRQIEEICEQESVYGNC